MIAFFCKLVPPRPTFAGDMTEHEVKLMQDHARYWTAGIEKGHVLVFGLVGDPDGAYGIGIVEFADETAARAFTADDPVIRARAGFRYDIHPMPLGATRR